MPEMVARRSQSGWSRVALGDVVDIINQYWDRDTTLPERLVAGEHIDEGDLRVRRWAMTDDDLIPPTFNRWFQSGDVLLHSRNIKKVAQPDFGGITGEKLFILRSKDASTLLQSLVPYFVQSEAFRSYAESRWAGSTNKFLNKTPLQEFEFALPPIEEQLRVAAVLAASDATMSVLFDAATALNAMRHSLMKAHFFEARSQSSSRRIGDVAAVSNGSTPRRGRGDYWGGRIPWLPTGKVNDRRITEADEWITDAALAECPLRLIPSGSTLVAMIGQGATRGRAALLEIDATINQNFAAVVPRADVLPKFLFYQLEASYEGLRHVSQGSNQLALNCQLIANVLIHVPSTAEQQEVVMRLDWVEDAIDALGERKRAAEAVRRQLVAQTLAGTCG